MFTVIRPGDEVATAPRRPPAQEEPRPIQYRSREVRTLDGTITISTLMWFNDDAARCRFCPPGSCTFIANPAGVGTCEIEREGPLGRRAVPLSGGPAPGVN